MYFHNFVLLGFVDLYQEHLRNVTYLELVNHSNDQVWTKLDCSISIPHKMFTFYQMLLIIMWSPWLWLCGSWSICMFFRGWARMCSFTGILDFWCFMGISWMHTFFWNNYGIAKPFDPISPILFSSWGGSHCQEKSISERTLFCHLESCSTTLSFSIDICEKVKTSP